MTARNRRQIDRNCGAVLLCSHKNAENNLYRWFSEVGFSARVSLRRKIHLELFAKLYMFIWFPYFSCENTWPKGSLAHGRMGRAQARARGRLLGCGAGGGWGGAAGPGPRPGPWAHGKLAHPCGHVFAQARYGNHINIYNSTYILEMYFSSQRNPHRKSDLTKSTI